MLLDRDPAGHEVQLGMRQESSNKNCTEKVFVDQFLSFVRGMNLMGPWLIGFLLCYFTPTENKRHRRLHEKNPLDFIIGENYWTDISKTFWKGMTML